MTKIVQAGPMTGGDTADADLPGQGVKGPPDLSFIQPPTTAGRKEVGRSLAREYSVPANCVIAEYL